MWETVNAKLHYEKHLIDLREGGSTTGSVFGEDATSSSVAVEDGYSDFGEPRASPRVNMKQTSSSSHHHHHRFGNHNGSGEQLNEMSDTVSPTSRGGVKRGAAESSSERPHRACFAVGATDGSTSNDHLFAGINGSISSGCGFEFSPDRVETEAHRKEFLNQRAGHYNEFKVLKAMRAKLLEEDDEDD